MRGMSSHLATIANAMSYTENCETEVVVQDKKLLPQIASLSSIIKAKTIKVAYLFSSNPIQIEVSSPDDDWKKEVVLDMIHHNEPLLRYELDDDCSFNLNLNVVCYLNIRLGLNFYNNNLNFHLKNITSL